MAIFDRFKRKQRVVLPEEINEYYQSQRRERVSVAVILGVVALVVTLLIATALFFGGRFIYRQVADKDQKKSGQSQTQDAPTEDTNKTNTQNGGQVDAPTNPSPAPGTTPSNPSTPAPTTAQPTPAPSSTPALGDNQALPRTGDEGM